MAKEELIKESIYIIEQLDNHLALSVALIQNKMEAAVKAMEPVILAFHETEQILKYLKILEYTIMCNDDEEK